MLRTSPIGEVLIELSEIDSTNNYAMRLINEGMAEHGMTVRADFQTNGKGQHGNVWLAEESKNLLFTTILDTQGFQLQNQFLLNTFSCLSVAEYLMTNIGLRNITIKWPNDIYAGNKKIAGILIENIIRGSAWNFAIVGIGLNVNQTHFNEMNWATSIQIESGKTYKIAQVLKQLMKILNSNFKKYELNQTELLATYNSMLYKAGDEIMYKKNYELYRGIIVGADETGLLTILVNGKKKSFKHKEIELVLN
ncbi:MAG TPA: biotin--[acetyl-CoA-carboxylase] ligase [Chitinophagaceae bacterium]|nr:biotin--[acetyl-CoA-carboxylase] ligase [Chitinophagaceae bacterium]